MFDKNEYLEKDQKENLRVKEQNKRNDRSPSPELPNAGEEQRSRASTPERSGIRSLKCEMAKGLGRSNQSPSMQKNRNEQNTGKDDLEVRKLRNPETRHSLQRRGRGVKATPRTAMWVTQRLAESPQEQRKGILGLWVHPKRQAEVTDETIEEINALSDEDAMEALKELRRPIQYIRKQGGQQMNFEARLQTLEDG
jgi:hypothetical protein